MTPEEMHDRPLWHACFHHRSLARLKQSLKAGIPIDFVYFDSITLLVQASLYGCEQVVEWCIDNGANLNHQSETGHSALTNTVSGHFEQCFDEYGRRESCGHRQVLKLLLEAGADPNIKTFCFGRTPLGYLTKIQRESGEREDMEEFALLLLEHGAIGTYESPPPAASRLVRKRKPDNRRRA